MIMKDFIDIIAKNTHGISRTEAISKHMCIDCKQNVIGFNDKLSEKEYYISGLCQHCQDSIFS